MADGVADEVVAGVAGRAAAGARAAGAAGAGRVHVVGAGLAGLSAALCLAERGVAVSLHEAAGHAGGRCRSFHDTTLDRVIDNGNHLVLTGNDAVARYLTRAGAAAGLRGALGRALPGRARRGREPARGSGPCG
ncbi:MAG: NAD(P)-binding protein, partial [Pseudomonadota bacterium]